MASQNPNLHPFHPHNIHPTSISYNPTNPNPISYYPNPNPISYYPNPISYYPNPNPNPNPNPISYYPNPNPNPNPNPSSSSLYPSLTNHFPYHYHHNPTNPNSPSAPPQPQPQLIQDTLFTFPGALLHLIDPHYSLELAVGDFTVVRIRDGDNPVAVIASVSDDLQWPITNDEAIVKLDDSHYFFSFPDHGGVDVLNYGLSFATKGQDERFGVLDEIFRTYSNFTEQRVSEQSRGDVAGVGMTRDLTPNDLKTDGAKREMMERNCGAYWTTLAPNVEEYSSRTARLIASGSGKFIQGILWCGDVTSDRLNWGHQVLRKRIDPCDVNKEIDESTMKRIRRVKRTTKMTQKVAEGVLSGVVRVSGYVTSSVTNSKAGKKFFSMLPGEMILASLDGFNRISDAVEVAGKNVMSTSSTVTTGVVTQKYGEEAGKATHEGLGAAGHALGTAWTVLKMRKALNPKSSIKPTSLAKSAVKAAAADYKSQKSMKK